MKHRYPTGIESNGYHPNIVTERVYTDVLTIRRQGNNWQDVTLSQDTLTIGRATDNDIVLDDYAVSRFHCELERSEDGWVVRDLNSTNGLDLDGQILEERQPVVWKEKLPLMLGEFELVWRRHYHERLHDATIILMNGNLKDEHLEPQLPLIQLELPEREFRVFDGSRTTFEFELVNSSGQVDDFRLSVDGLPAEWVNFERTLLTLEPNRRERQRLTLDLSRYHCAENEQRQFTINVEGVMSAQATATASAQLSIEPTSKSRIFFDQSDRPYGAVCDIVIQNEGINADFYNIVTRSPSDLLKIMARDWQIALPAAMSDTLRIGLLVRKRPLFGKVRQLPYEVEAISQGGMVERFNGSVTVRPRISVRMIAIGVLMLLVLAAVLWGSSELRQALLLTFEL